MTASSSAFRKGMGKPETKARPRTNLPGYVAPSLMRTLVKDTGAGWFQRGFVYLFGDAAERLDACLDAWKWLLPKHGERAVIGHNAYGALLVVEVVDVMPEVRVLDPVLLAYYSPMHDMLGSFVANRLGARDLDFFLQRGLFDAWRARSKKKLGGGQMLPVRMPKAEGGLRDAAGLEPVDIVEHYRSTSKALAREAKVPEHRYWSEPHRSEHPELFAHLDAGALPDALAKALRSRSKVTSLSLEHLGLTTVPKEVFRLKDLWHLSLAGNRLKTLPAEIGALRELGRLDLLDNELVELPETLSQLSSLTWLRVAGNRLRALPDSFGALRKLQYLFAEDNQIAALPDMSRMRALRTVDLARNRLTKLPASLGGAREVDVRENRLRAIPPALVKTGVKLDARDNLGLPSTAGARVRSVEGSVARMTSTKVFAKVRDPNLRLAIVQSLVDEKRVPYKSGADLPITRIDAKMLAGLRALSWSSTSSLLFAIEDEWDGESTAYRIGSFRGIEVCAGLRSISIFYESAATDLRPLAKLPKLAELSIVGGPLEDLRPLAKLPALTKLEIVDCAVADASPLLDCATLKEVKLGGVVVDRALSSQLKKRGVRLVTP